ncbi:MAG: DUF1624 domain-containing protein [Acidobacteria bacterium]|nr:DUF1624 domain-containing protein [Acidobacteriota bacterium]
MPRAGSRLLSMDALRGLIMVLMAVDHASYFIARVHPGEFWGSALPRYADALAFLTRWITHLCAPGFFFLMGAGMVLFAAARRQAGWTERRIVRFFVTRGILLILLQLCLENPAWLLGRLGSRQPLMDPPGGGGDVLLHFGVLYGLGATMIAFAFLMRARTMVIVLLSLGAILATQWLTPSAAETGVLFSPWLRLLLIPGHTGVWQSFYPLVPWLGVTGLGVMFGRVLIHQGERAFRHVLPAGAGFLALFVLLRWAGGFGNFHPWESGWIGFFNVTKYPPSLAFLLVTLGLNFLLLFVFHKMEAALPRAARPLLVFGRSPLFFYIVHLYVYGLMGLAFPDGTGYAVMYLFWLIGLIVLFPLCVWYGRFKRRKPVESVWKLF